MEKVNMFVGWDSREVRAYDACIKSLQTNFVQGDRQLAINQQPLIIGDLEQRGLYSRRQEYPDEVASTEFAFTRFLAPYLSNYQGWSIFCDCDFIFTHNIAEVLDFRNDDYAVMCVKHEYIPKTATKMDGQKQTAYPRKNWSSFMMFNNAHPHCKNLNPATVSNESGAWLHQMKWTTDRCIGRLSQDWNWLVGEFTKREGHTPYVLHYTLGCPFFEGQEDCDYAEEYWKYDNQPV